MENEQILQKILEAYDQQIAGNRKAEAVIRKIGKKMATYADAQEMAVVCGQVLEDSLREYLPEALTDGMLYREAAEVVLKEPLLHSGEQVADVARQVQQELNEAAGIGLNAIEPALNMDQVDGIVTGVCNAQSYDSYKETLFAQATNFLQGTVDDTVRENAEFQYKAGLEPTIVRYAVGKCCEWCDGLAGTYPYERIRNKGNDVFRRHKNCRCVVEYNPGNGSKKRQNVHTRQWTEETDSDTIEQRRNQPAETVHRKLYASELRNGLPIKSSPNSISDKLDDEGNAIQRRIYGATGRAEIDYDLTDHGETWKYPTGAHKHVFDYTGRKIRRKNADMTDEDIEKNSDVLIRGVNYFDQ